MFWRAGASHVGLSRFALMPGAAVLASVVAAAASAGAQTIPPSGDPPGPEQRAAEQQAIQQQAKQAWFNQHRSQLWNEAQQEVDQERRDAWLERGRRLVPPAVTITPPELQVALVGGIGGSAGSKHVKQARARLGGQLELRGGSWWALQVGGGLERLGDTFTYVNSSAAWGDAAFLLLLSTLNPYLGASHSYVGLGVQTLFPLGKADVPGAFLGPYLNVGFVSVFGHLQNGYGYAGIMFEWHLGGRFALESAKTDPFQGLTLGVVAGPVLGF